MPLFAIAFNSGSVTTGSVQNGVETEIHAFCDGQSHTFTTKANVVSQALEGTSCSLNENDIVNPDKDTILNGSSINVNVIKAVPVTIDDNGELRLEKSAYKNVADIFKQLEITVYPEDKVTAELIMSDFGENGLGQKIRIVRNPSVILEADGNILEVKTSKSTVGEFLAEKGIALGPKDEVAPSTQVAITRGMKITVTRVMEADIQENEVIPYETISKNDNNVFQGQSRVESEGAGGLKKKISKAVYRNGVLSAKTTVTEQVVQAPKPKIIVVGAKPYGAGDLWPIIVEAGAQWGIDPGKLYRVALCESGANPLNNRNPIYKGLFQYLPSTWAGASSSYPGGRFRGASIFDPTAQIHVTAWKASKQGWKAWPSCGRR